MASRLDDALQYGSQGAATGFALGGLPGAAIGAGIGAIGGTIAGAETEGEALQRERMEELMRRQELGQLGLTDQEMNVALGQAQGALSQQQRAQRAQQAGLLATTGVGAGAAMRAGQEEASQQRREMAEARQRVEEADVAQRRAEERELQVLGQLEQKRAAEERAAMLDALGTTASTISGLRDAEMLQKQAEDVRDQRERKAAEEKKAAAERNQKRREAMYGGKTQTAISASLGDSPGSVPAPGTAKPKQKAIVGQPTVEGLMLKEAAEAALMRTGQPPEMIEALMLQVQNDPVKLRQILDTVANSVGGVYGQ